MSRSAYTALALAFSILAAGSAQAGKPAGSASDPVLGFMINGGSGWDLKIADENGGNAFRIYAGSTSVAFDLSSKGSNRAAIIDRNVARLINWTVAPSGGVTTSVVDLDDGPGNAMSLAFSQDGSQLAVFTSPDKVMHIFDAATGAELRSWQSEWAFDISWFADGTGLVINAPPLEGSGSGYRLMTYGADGSSPSTLALFESLEDIDASRSPTSRRVLVSYGTLTDIRIAEYENGAQVGYHLALGYAQSWRCDGQRFVYQRYSSSGATNPWYFQDMGGGSSLFSKVTKTRKVRYMKCPAT